MRFEKQHRKMQESKAAEMRSEENDGGQEECLRSIFQHVNECGVRALSA